MADRGGRAARGAGRGAARGAGRGDIQGSRKRTRPGEPRVPDPVPTGPLHTHALLQFPEGTHSYTHLAGMVSTPVYPARTIDWPLMETIGVADRLRETFRGPWRRLIEVPAQQYHELTLELFSSSFFTKKASIDTDGAVRFTLGGTDYSYSIREWSWRSGLYTRDEADLPHFETLFQGYAAGEAPLHVQKSQLAAFWSTIGEGQWSPGTKSSCILDPYVRYVHRVIGGTIWGRYHGTDKVTELDLYILYCLLTPVEANVAIILASYLSHDRRKAARICGGAYVTMLAGLLGTFDAYPVEGLTSAEGAVHIPLSDLDSMEIITYVDGQPRFIEPRVPAQPVPIVEGQEAPEGQGPQAGQAQPPAPRARRRRSAPRIQPEPAPEAAPEPDQRELLLQMRAEQTQQRRLLEQQGRLLELIMDSLEIPFPADIPRHHASGSGSGGASGSA